MGYRKLPPLVMPTDPAVLGYVAGIVDGEGYVGITTAFDRRTSKNPSHAARVVVINTDLRLIGWFAETFGGVVMSGDHDRAKGWKTRYTWQINGKRCEQFLVALRPYLRLKGEQADVILALRATGLHRGGGLGHGGVALAAHVVAEREALKQRIHVLNARGKEKSA